MSKYVAIIEDLWLHCPSEYKKGMIYKAIDSEDPDPNMQWFINKRGERDGYYPKFFREATRREYEEQNKITVCDE